MKNYYRSPKTIQEKRANQENWHRGKRSPRNLPDNWDDKPIRHQKSWKSKRKTQYIREEGFTKHSIILEWRHFTEWYLEEYFEENTISHKIERINIRHFVESGYRPTHWRKYNGIIQYGYITSKTIGTKVTWWYNKDIGLKYLLKQIRNVRNR